MNLLDPRIAEWDLLALCAIPQQEREPPELKHLSRGGKEIKRDSVSSGE